jgi:hypothetical protein
MMDLIFDHEHTTEPDFQFLLRKRIRDLGCENTMAFFQKYAAENMEQLAHRLSVSTDELRFNFLCEGFEQPSEHATIRLYSIELLVRMLWSVPDGWQKRKSGRMGAGTLRQLRSWETSPALVWNGFELATSSVVRAMLHHEDLKHGWRPHGSSDQNLVSIFDRHWHLSACN